MVNGQHRLQALIKASKKNPNITLKSIVVRGVSEDSFSTYDSGATRSTADALGGVGAKDRGLLSGIINNVLKWRRGVKITSAYKVSTVNVLISKQDAIEEYEGNEEYYALVCKISNNLYKSASVLSRVEIGSFFVWLNKEKKHQDDIVFNFFSQLCSLSESSNETIEALRKRLFQDILSKTKFPVDYKRGLIIKTWNAYIGGKELKSIRWNAQTEGDIDFI